MSIVQNQLGLGATVSHAINFEKLILEKALRSNLINQVIFNRIGKGDDIYLVLKDGADD
jgi:hypothetical protein